MTTVLLIAGIGGIFLAIMLSLTAVGVFDNEARGVSKSLAVMEAYTAAPPELRQELDPSFNERVLAPLLDRALKIGKKLDFPQVFVMETDGGKVTALRAYEPYGPNGMGGVFLGIERLKKRIFG